MQVATGEIAAVIGANGAGKSTLLKSIAGLMPARRDASSSRASRCGDLPALEIVARGVALVPEGPAVSIALGRGKLMIGGQLAGPARGRSGASTSCSRC